MSEKRYNVVICTHRRFHFWAEENPDLAGPRYKGGYANAINVSSHFAMDKVRGIEIDNVYSLERVGLKPQDWDYLRAMERKPKGASA